MLSARICHTEMLKGLREGDIECCKIKEIYIASKMLSAVKGHPDQSLALKRIYKTKSRLKYIYAW